MLIQAGDYSRALQEYTTLSGAAPDDSTRGAAFFGIGRVQLLQDNPALAITTLTDAITRFPQVDRSASAEYFLGQAYAAMNNQPKALEAYAAYLQKKPGVLDAYVQELSGDTFAAMDDYKSALDAYSAAIKAPQLGDPTEIKLKTGQMYAALGDNQNALRTYLAVYDATQSDFYKAQANLLAGQIYLKMGMTDQAYARFQDSVNNFPDQYDSYSGLVTLVNAGVTVNELNRAIVDYYAGQYGYALEAFNRYLSATPKPDAAAHYYKARTLIELDQAQNSLAEWDALMKDYTQQQWNLVDKDSLRDIHLSSAWDEKAYIQWAYLDLYPEAAQTLLDFVNQAPADPSAPAELFEAGRILERNNLLDQAAQTWETVMQKYPSSDYGFSSLLLAGVTYFRLAKFDQALPVFQRALVLGLTPSEQASAYLWIGKTQVAQNDLQAAQTSWDAGAQVDPTGYYSERCRELQLGQAPFQEKLDLNLTVDQAAERKLAEGWMRVTFNLPSSTDFSTLGALASDPRIQRASAFWELGLYAQARDEYESVRLDIQNDPESNFRLLTTLLNQGFYRSAILTARQILTLSGMDDAATLSAPSYFNHIRFGLYFQDYVLSAAQTENLNPLFIFSLIRQESLFEGFATSGAGARGVMQIIPATGSEVAANLGWPPDFTAEDLYLPMVSIRLGVHYLVRQSDAFNGDLFAALAAYNGGPGNALAWSGLSNNDPDLLLEVIRIQETRTYIMQIFEFYGLYERLYAKNQ
jgi:soluble lytic murein transglycosylase